MPTCPESIAPHHLCSCCTAQLLPLPPGSLPLLPDRIPTPTLCPVILCSSHSSQNEHVSWIVSILCSKPSAGFPKVPAVPGGSALPSPVPQAQATPGPGLLPSQRPFPPQGLCRTQHFPRHLHVCTLCSKVLVRSSPPSHSKLQGPRWLSRLSSQSTPAPSLPLLPLGRALPLPFSLLSSNGPSFAAVTCFRSPAGSLLLPLQLSK